MHTAGADQYRRKRKRLRYGRSCSWVLDSAPGVAAAARIALDQRLHPGALVLLLRQGVMVCTHVRVAVPTLRSTLGKAVTNFSVSSRTDIRTLVRELTAMIPDSVPTIKMSLGPRRMSLDGADCRQWSSYETLATHTNTQAATQTEMTYTGMPTIEMRACTHNKSH